MTARRKSIDSLDRRALAARLGRGHDRLPPVQRRVAEYVLRHYREVAFMGVAELAAAVRVSPAAVVRFATSMEFAGYPGLQRALHAIVLGELRQADRFTASLDGSSSEALAERVLAQEVANVAALRTRLDRTAFEEAVRLTAAAPAVAVVGFRASSILAQYLWYNLRKVKDRVRLYTAPGSATVDDLALSDPATLVVLLTFRRYSRELMDVATFAGKAGFPTIGVTNNELSPLVRLCRTPLLVEVGELSFTDYYAAPLALLNALTAEVARRLGRRALLRLRRLDDVAVEQEFLVP